MTGGELLVRKNNLYCLTKVSSDGYDLKDFATLIKQNPQTLHSPRQVCLDYLTGRKANGFSTFDYPPYDTQTNLHYYEKNVVSKAKGLENQFNTVQQEIEQEIMKIPVADGDSDLFDEDHPYNQLCCSYCDYVLFICLDTGTIMLNGVVV